MTPAPLSIGLVGYHCVAAGIFRVHRAHIFPVVCSSLARLCSYFGKRGAGFKSLKDSWADTTTPHGRLMLTVLGGLAEFERELIRARTGEGRIRAKARGVKFGRPRKMTPHQRQEALQRLHAGETMADVARTYAVDAATISRLAASSPFEHGAAGAVQ
jgi:DNA invertase Pin-like site-specific DNA recombinase